MEHSLTNGSTVQEPVKHDITAGSAAQVPVPAIPSGRAARLAAATQRLGSAAMRRTLVQVLARYSEEPRSTGEHLAAVMNWLCSAQDAAGGGGVSYGYGLLEGWWPPYPETTGYCIPTFLRYATLTGDASYQHRAQAMAEWELTVQSPEGFICGGPVRDENRVGVAFDTAQVLQGWLAMYVHSRDVRFLQAACRAGDWLVRNLGPEGTWHDTAVSGRSGAHAYNTRSCWPLLQLSAITHCRSYAEAAQKHLEWTLANQATTGWFRGNSFEPDAPALTHTIAYVIEGLIESWGYLWEDALIKNATKAADALRSYFDTHGWLPATFDEAWQSKDRYSCVTGCAQIALVWYRLARLLGREDFAKSAERLSNWLKTVQFAHGRQENVAGALPGSYPVYGAYEPMRLPNWAAKFFADAMLAELEFTKGRAVA